MSNKGAFLMCGILVIFSTAFAYVGLSKRLAADEALQRNETVLRAIMAWDGCDDYEE